MTARLLGRIDNAKWIDLSVSDTVRMGSGSENELRIDSRTLSRNHAQLVKFGSEFYLEDLGSRNGTFLNGQRVTRFPVRNLDVISLGPAIDLIFLESGAAAVAPPPRPELTASVMWMDGPLAGRIEPIPSEGLALGRSTALESLTAISRRHAFFIVRGDRLTVEDLGSANGTSVNGVPITAVTALDPGDEVSLGGLVRLRVAVTQSAAPPAPPLEEGSLDTMVVEYPSPNDDRPLNVPRPARLPARRPDLVVAAPVDPPAPTIAAPPEPASVPQFPANAAGSQPESATFGAFAEPAVVVPDGLAARARAARRAAPPLDSTPLAGVMLDGPTHVKLNLGTFEIGRHPEADVVIDSRDISRRHARLYVRPDGVRLEALETANGTFVDDVAITGTAEVPDGSRVRFATVEFAVIYVRTRQHS